MAPPGATSRWTSKSQSTRWLPDSIGCHFRQGKRMAQSPPPLSLPLLLPPPLSPSSVLKAGGGRASPHWLTKRPSWQPRGLRSCFWPFYWALAETWGPETPRWSRRRTTSKRIGGERRVSSVPQRRPPWCRMEEITRPEVGESVRSIPLSAVQKATLLALTISNIVSFVICASWSPDIWICHLQPTTHGDRIGDKKSGALALSSGIFGKQNFSIALSIGNSMCFTS